MKFIFKSQKRCGHYLWCLVFFWNAGIGIMHAQDQRIQITGQVVDVSGTPLPGANVLEVGTTNGVVTDFDGNYTILISSSSAILSFSYVGFKTIKVVVGNQRMINIALQEDAQGLDEVVVIGYGTQRKSDVTGAVVRVTTEKTADLANTNVVESIRGLAPGITVSSGSAGTVGEDPSFLIRGRNSLTASNSPLIVVDDVIYNGSISDFNSNDIESVDILKDASAAVVYGARAANGVILITTKKGRQGKPKFSFNTYTGFQKADDIIPQLDGPGYEQKIADYNEIVLGDNPNAQPIALNAIEEANKAQGIETDWMDKIFRTALISNYHLDVSGGTEATNYYVSGTYLDQEGIVKNDNFERLTLNLNLSTQLTDWLSFGVRSTYVHRDVSGIQASVEQAFRQSPYGNFYDEDGPGGYAFFPIGEALGEHPLINTLIDDEDKHESVRGVFSLKLDFPFISGLRWTMNYGANIRNRFANRFVNNQQSTLSQTLNGIASKNTIRNNDWTLDNILNYKKTIADKHSLDVTFLLSRESRTVDETLATANDFPSQELGFNGLQLGAIQQSNSNRESQNSLSQMGRINYGFDNKYALTYTIRRDGFSAFAENNKYALFQAGAFAWTISNEKFLKESNWLNYLKLRLSYGENGNQGIDRFSSLAKLYVNQYIFGNGGTFSTLGNQTLANNDLTWETTTSKNIGLDFQLFNNRISGSLDAYLSNTEDLLQLRQIPNITGFGSVLTNIGEVENKGFELSLNSKNIDTPNFDWETGVVFSLNRNKIVSLGGTDADNDGMEDDDIANGWFIGEDINSIFSYKTDGIYQLNDDIPEGFDPGDYRIVDTDGNGIINPDDRQILGTTSPNYIVSLSNTLRYRGFSLYVMVYSVQGGGDKNYYVADNFDTRSVNRRGFTTFVERFNIQDVPYWTPHNPTNDYPVLNYIPPFDHPILEDRSFVRIQDISLAYNFRPSILDKIGVTNLKVYTSLKNLYTFTNWTGYNPETSSTVRDLPFSKSYTLGLDFSF